MIKYPVRIGFYNRLDGTHSVIDSDTNDIAICDTEKLAETIVNALNALNEFPDDETLRDERWEISDDSHHWLARWCQDHLKYREVK